ncbi:uncharacterized protein LOC122548582 [Chiloscyllium plagiosum]|uniref:uncharacterized protein LOC122548582 n=1 Tax=Chiloscyllium plagiosum TaxID=36176 RepID=UPI001CB83BA3|nr:uncharacterized protein LOC122548582 [Chiloscyllium plagiosum]
MTEAVFEMDTSFPVCFVLSEDRMNLLPHWSILSPGSASLTGPAFPLFPIGRSCCQSLAGAGHAYCVSEARRGACGGGEKSRRLSHVQQAVLFNEKLTKHSVWTSDFISEASSSVFIPSENSLDSLTVPKPSHDFWNRSGAIAYAAAAATTAAANGDVTSAPTTAGTTATTDHAAAAIAAQTTAFTIARCSNICVFFLFYSKDCP